MIKKITFSKEENQNTLDAKKLPRIGAFFGKYMQDFLKYNRFAKILATRLSNETGTRFSDWIDSWVLPGDVRTQRQLEKLGFVQHAVIKNLFFVENTCFPRVFLRDSSCEILFKVDSILAFQGRHQLTIPIQGDAHYTTRKIPIFDEPNYILSIIERSTLFPHTLPTEMQHEEVMKEQKALYLWFNRERKFSSTIEGMRHTLALAYRIVDMVGVDCAAHIVLQGELRHWQFKTTIADLQKFSQDKLGLGWGNCDHIMFWSSRDSFKILIQIFEVLGFRCRTKFFIKDYGNKGVQVLEHPYSNILIVCEVHLRKPESKRDFAHETLPAIKKSGIIDNWVKANGESILDGGAKHVGLRCNIEKMKEHIQNYGVNFTTIDDKPHFKQAYSNSIVSKFENYMCIVERNMGFHYFDIE